MFRKTIRIRAFVKPRTLMPGINRLGVRTHVLKHSTAKESRAGKMARHWRTCTVCNNVIDHNVSGSMVPSFCLGRTDFLRSAGDFDIQQFRQNRTARKNQSTRGWGNMKTCQPAARRPVNNRGVTYAYATRALGNLR